MPDSQDMIKQHHELVALCHKLDEAAKRNAELPYLYGIMDEIIACTEQHFKSEELLMAETGYPEIEAHKAKHKELLENTRKFREQIDLYGEANFSEWFNHWPFAYIIAHIQFADHQIADFITGKNG
jgi:hemerythrin